MATKAKHSRVSAINSRVGTPRYKVKHIPLNLNYDKDTQESIFKEIEQTDIALNGSTEMFTDFKTWIQAKRYYEQIQRGEIPEVTENKILSKVNCTDNLWLKLGFMRLVSVDVRKQIMEQERLDLIEILRKNMAAKKLEYEATENKYDQLMIDISLITSEYTRCLYDSKMNELAAPSADLQIRSLSRKLDTLGAQQQEYEFRMEILHMKISKVDREIWDLDNNKDFDPNNEALADFFDKMTKLNVHQYQMNKKMEKVEERFSNISQDRINEQMSFNLEEKERKVVRSGKGTKSSFSDIIRKRCEAQVDKLINKKNGKQEPFAEASEVDLNLDLEEGQFGDSDSDPGANSGGVGISLDKQGVIVETKKQFVQPIESTTKKIEMVL